MGDHRSGLRRVMSQVMILDSLIRTLFHHLSDFFSFSILYLKTIERAMIGLVKCPWLAWREKVYR